MSRAALRVLGGLATVLAGVGALVVGKKAGEKVARASEASAKGRERAAGAELVEDATEVPPAPAG